jgi:hypothetical protein
VPGSLLTSLCLATNKCAPIQLQRSHHHIMCMAKGTAEVLIWHNKVAVFPRNHAGPQWNGYTASLEHSRYASPRIACARRGMVMCFTDDVQLHIQEPVFEQFVSALV